MTTTTLLQTLDSAQSIVQALHRFICAGTHGMDTNTFCRLLLAFVIETQADLATAIDLAQRADSTKEFRS